MNSDSEISYTSIISGDFDYTPNMTDTSFQTASTSCDDEVGLMFEPSRGKTNNVVSEQVRHKPTCTSTEAG